MFDLDHQLRQWRHELEATLAFSTEEIDELEDHIRLSYEAKLKEGISPENAWTHSLGDLGSASALALEFANEKLMPALRRLFFTWWQPALLFSLLIITFIFCLQKTGKWMLNGTLPPGPWASIYEFLGVSGITLVATLILLPQRSQKNSVLVGIANALCLIPLLHLLFYNPATEYIVGIGWIHMAAAFGWLSISLSLLGLIGINIWWWRHSRLSPESFPTILAVAATIVLIFTLSPFLGELVGHLSIRELYELPTAHQITLTGDAKIKYLNFEFVAVLINSMVFIQHFQPMILILVASIGTVAVQWITRGLKRQIRPASPVFPATRDLPWIMLFISSGVCWSISSYLEPSLSERFREVEKSVFRPADSHGGMEIMVLCSALLFFIAANELTRRLRQSLRIRPFYASLLVVAGLTSLLGFVPRLLNFIFLSTKPYDHSSEPLWLTCALILIVISISAIQMLIIRSRICKGACETSIWQFEGKNLVELGLLLGLVIACSGLLLFMVAIDMAFMSVTFITALIAWGNSIAKPATSHFNPQDYGISDHIGFWMMTGVGYGTLCLAFGLGIAIVLSAFEFIRFNSFRLYKIQKVRQESTETLALSE